MLKCRGGLPPARALALPSGFNPRTVALGRQWAQELREAGLTPSLAIAMLYSVTQAWNEYIVARVILQSSELYTWPLGLFELQGDFSILMVTHNMQQAARVSEYTAYMYLGELIEFGATDELFLKPSRKETEDYITGRFG